MQHEKRTVPWRCLAMCPRLQSLLTTESTPWDDLSPLLDIDLKILSPGEDPISIAVPRVTEPQPHL